MNFIGSIFVLIINVTQTYLKRKEIKKGKKEKTIEL